MRMSIFLMRELLFYLNFGDKCLNPEVPGKTLWLKVIFLKRDEP